MRVDELLSTARDAIEVKRVFAEPYEKDGVTVLAAAAVRGGGGGGSGNAQDGQEGEGAGFGMTGRPAGAYVIKNGDATWRPAVDVNRLMLTWTVGAVAIVFLLSRTRIKMARLKAAG